MDALKKVVGGGGSNQQEALSGQEPVSGVEGEGTAGQPFDAGNSEGDTNLSGKAASQTGNSSVEGAGQEPVSGVQGAGTAEKPFDAGNSENSADLAGKPPQRTDSEYEALTLGVLSPKRDPLETTSESAPVNDTPPKLEKKPTIGSSRWFTNANPFSKTTNNPEEDKENTGEAQSTSPTQPSATEPKKTLSQQPSTLPPNHLGDDVPPGQETFVFDPTSDPAFTASGNMPNHLGENVPPGQANGHITDKGKGKARMSPEQAEQFESRQDFPSSRTESSSVSTRRLSESTQYTIGTRQTYSTAGTGASIAGSSRRASAAVHIVHSQGKPITAGGVPLGLPAMEERERRLSFSVPEEDFAETNTARDANVVAGVEGTKHHDFASAPTRPAQTANKPVPATARDPASNRTEATETKLGADNLRRRSSIMLKAKDFGRRVRHSISK